MWRTKTWTGMGSAVSAAVILLLAEGAFGLQKVRHYNMGESDTGAAIGGLASFTTDISVDPTLSNRTDPPVPICDGHVDNECPYEFADIEAPTNEARPTYVAGRGGSTSSTLALSFDGVDDEFQYPRFDPRDWRGGGNTFTTLSQGWFKPSSAGNGRRQYIYSIGHEQGGLGISEDGFWITSSWNFGNDIVTDEPVAFDQWTHVAQLRGGNGVTTYINGVVVATGSAFWGGSDTFNMGNRIGSLPPDYERDDTYYQGAVDDFAISAFGFLLSPTFDIFRDIDYFRDVTISGVAGDVDQDGDVDVNDYNVWSRNVGLNNGQNGTGGLDTLIAGDVNLDGRVNFFDLNIIRANLPGDGVGIVSAVPEPTSALLGLMVFAPVVSLIRRRRSA